jgi:hypothetical protein
MRQRLPILLSASALAVAVLGATPLGHAAGSVVAKALFAVNAGKVNGIKASRKPKAKQLLALGKDAKFPLRVSGTGAAAAGSLADPPAGPTETTIAQTQVTTSSPGRLMALGRIGGVNYPCGGPPGTSCGFTIGLYVDGQPVPQTAAPSVPFCGFPGNPCSALGTGGTVFGVVAVKAGTHTVALALKTTSGTLGTPTSAPTGEVGAIAVG